MRLYDILRTVDPSFPNCTALIADAIAERIDSSEAAPDFENWPPDAYDVVAPPWPVFFVETRTKAVLGDLDVLVERGMLVRDMSHDPLIQQCKHLPPGVQMPDPTHWVLSMYGFCRFEHGDIELFPGQIFFHLDRAGRILDNTAAAHMVEYPANALLPGVSYLPIGMLATFAPFALFAVSALHQHAAVEHVVPSRQQRRAAERDGVALHSHYVLSVPSPVPQRRTVPLPPIASIEPQRREHQVRGHFRYYTEDKPLFGRIAGAVWIPAHARGDTARGTIEKGYAIRLNEQEV
jgi:hypothetical protein